MFSFFPFLATIVSMHSTLLCFRSAVMHLFLVRYVGDFKVGQEVKFQAFLHNGRLQGRHRTYGTRSFLCLLHRI